MTLRVTKFSLEIPPGLVRVQETSRPNTGGKTKPLVNKIKISLGHSIDP